MRFLDNPFGKMFDFNGDGKTDIGESWLGFKIIEDISKQENSSGCSSTTFYHSDNDETDVNDDWQLFADEGDEYGIDPYDYDTQEEYLEAVEDAESDIDIVGDDDWF